MRSDDAWLLDMLLAARDAGEFVAGLTYPQFERSRLYQNAVMKAVEIVGEAAARISDDARAAHPELPWREMIGMRNLLVHVYFEIDISRVWQTVQESLPTLVDQLEPLVPPEAE